MTKTRNQVHTRTHHKESPCTAATGGKTKTDHRKIKGVAGHPAEAGGDEVVDAGADDADGDEDDDDGLRGALASVDASAGAAVASGEGEADGGAASGA